MDIQWKEPPTKRAKLASSTDRSAARLGSEDLDNTEHRELVLSISSTGIQTDRPAVQSQPLVIPLIEKRGGNPSSSGAEKEGALSLDRQAELELLAESSGSYRHAAQSSSSGSDGSSGMVISDGPTEDGCSRRSLLMALIEHKKGSDMEGGKLDLSSHAQDIDFHSDVYQSVPVEEFGAALLRGMGWKGEAAADDSQKKLEQRHKRLGLGAAPFPGEKGKPSSTQHPSVTPAEAPRGLGKGARVLVESGPHSSKRAEVALAVGVPGLNMIRICLEGTGELVDIPRKTVRLLSKEELAACPFVLAPDLSAESVQEGQQPDGGATGPGDDAEEDPLRLGSFREAHAKEKEKEAKRLAAAKPAGTKGGPASTAERGKSWLQPGLRVKIVSSKLGDAYLCKGTIDDVYALGTATVRLDSGKIVDNVKERYLETVLPPCGGLCMVLAGELRGEVAKLLVRNDKDLKATVELVDSLEVVSISMDDISAFSDGV